MTSRFFKYAPNTPLISETVTGNTSFTNRCKSKRGFVFCCDNTSSDFRYLRFACTFHRNIPSLVTRCGPLTQRLHCVKSKSFDLRKGAPPPAVSEFKFIEWEAAQFIL